MPTHAETFSTGEVKALTGATARQLDWWTWTNFITPSGRRGRKRRYTFDDVLKIRMITQLRQRGYSLPFLRRVVERLRDSHSLGRIRLVDIDGELYLCHNWREVERATDGQLVWSVIAFGEAAKELKRRLSGLVVLNRRRRGKGSGEREKADQGEAAAPRGEAP